MLMPQIQSALFPRYLIAVLTLGAFCGCQPERQATHCVVRGVVLLADKPLANAIVTFTPRNETPGQGGFGRTSASGEFQIDSFEGQTGIAMGDYMVTISKILKPDGSDFPANSEVGPMDSDGRESLPKKYSDPAYSVLAAKVFMGSTYGFKLQLEATQD